MKQYARRKDDNQKAIEQRFKARGFKVFDLSKQGGGWPDLLVTKFNCHGFVECKSDKGRLTPDQVVFLAQLGNTLPIYFAQTDADVDEICAHILGKPVAIKSEGLTMPERSVLSGAAIPNHFALGCPVSRPSGAWAHGQGAG